MKIMILSDSHSMNKSTLVSILDSQQVDYYIHCGDIFMSYDALSLRNFYIVKGNNDFSNLPKELLITLDNKKIFITHGHTYDVEYTTDNLINKGLEVAADIICYGHTHAPLVKRDSGILIINPGSVTYPRGGYLETTYCILDTTTMEVTYYKTDDHSICDPFSRNKNKEKHSFFKNLFK